VITKLNYRRRLALLKDELKAKALDSILITNRTNVAYLSGFQGHDGVALVTLGEDFFITDSRYIEEARDALDGFCVKLVETSICDTVSEIISKKRLKRAGFEAMDLPYGVATRLHKAVKSAKLLPCKDIVEKLRAVKDAEEIVLIRNSIRVNKRVFESVIGKVKPGVSEISLARTIEAAFFDEGAKSAFEPIVASGKNASKPHAIPTDAAIRDNSFVMIDMGARLDGYCSDLTRMITLGRVTGKFKEIYNIVRTAQEAAIKAVRPGVMVREIDAAGRSHIASKGFGKYFGHSIGHGIGLDVHEKPTVSGMNDSVALPGMVFTIEPAIYIPKFGGVRIEDIVLVTDKGCEVLTK